MPFFKNTELRAGDVVEFYGAEGMEKSEILLKIIATCVLPKSWYGVTLPGRNVDVLFISNDCKVDLMRLAAIMEDIVFSHGAVSIPQAKRNELIASSLEHLHVVTCGSMEELVITLHSLKTFLSSHPEVCTLLIDNVVAFWWTEVATNPASDYMQQQWTSALSELIKEFHLIVIATRPLLTKDMTTTQEKVRDQ